MAPKSKKPVQAIIKLQLQAGKANPAPPLGPALGQHGVSIMDFCKAYNDATKDLGNTIAPVEIYVFPDRSFEFVLKTPPTATLIKEALKLKSGSATPNTRFVGTLKKDQIEKIAETKLPDLNATNLDAAIRVVAGTARSMGVKIQK